MFLVGSYFSACQKIAPGPKPQDHTSENQELKKLLPEKPGFRWTYNGFAEYGHVLELESISPWDSLTRYHLTGEVDDPSGGEAKGDFNLEVNYQIKNGMLVQEKTSTKMMDTFNELILIQVPLQKDNEWTQSVVDKEGKKYELKSKIADIKDEAGSKIYTVLYQDTKSDFFEKREIKEGIGVISFLKYWEGNDIGYTINMDFSGHKEQTTLKSFLPPLNQELRYYGLAEYAHVGKLTKEQESSRGEIYEFNGTFQDGSGIPGDFRVQYIFNYQDGTIQEKVVENTRDEVKEVNSKLHNPIIMKLPLEVGNYWEQEITIDGKSKTMKAKIVSIAIEGSTFYSREKNPQPVVTVQYVVEDVPGYYNNMYFEERDFQKGWGMIGFSQLMKGDLGITEKMEEYQIEQTLIQNMFGYGLAKPQP